MSFTKFSNLDFDQIKESIKDYLRANSKFTDFDFEGSNFSVLIDTLAYNAYINAVNANMVANESFLDSATLRRNVVSLAGNIGYVPRSKKAAQTKVFFQIRTDSNTPTLTLKAGLVLVGEQERTNYLFSIPEDITTTVVDGIAQFGTESEPIIAYQGTYLQNLFTYDGSLDQRFIINNSSMDYNTLSVRIKDANETGSGNLWRKVENIIQVDSTDEVYFINEVENEYYELIFGDGIFGKPLQTGQIINATYIITDGETGNGPSKFTYNGSVVNSNGAVVVPTNTVVVNTVEGARKGANIESIQSVKYYAPRLYGAQYRAVTTRDYEGIVKEVYPNAESISVVGGEELDPPQFGNVFISIKPVNGVDVSDFDKKNILDSLKSYTIAGVNQQIVDLKVLYVEIESSIYYDNTKVDSGDSLKTSVITSLNRYAKSVDLSRFGGRFKYSKVQKVIDDTNRSITSNITNVIIRRDLNAVTDNFAQYELCFGNAFYYKASGGNIKSSGFRIFGLNDVVYFTDIPNKSEDSNLDGSNLGTISIVSELKSENGDVRYKTVVPDIGTVDYAKGEIVINTIRIISTAKENNVIEVQAYPQSNDVIGLKDLYISFDVKNSKINMVRDTISSGEQISGVGFKVTSSYGNGNLSR